MNFGDVLIWLALLTTAGAMLGYLPNLLSAKAKTGLKWARLGVFASAGFMLVAIGYLWFLILTHQFQFSYVFRYSSLDMPLRYVVASLWGGQEGTFLMWAVFAGLLAVFLRYKARHYEAAVQFFYMGITLFLLLMLTKASPFKLLDTVPADGNGLNPLLQDPWMTIHPPITFFGFAALGIPAAFAMAALVREDWDNWVPRALPWTIFGVFSLGAGLTLGGYWSYSILGWGGYWGWDPVENSSLVPWLFGVALIHTQVVQIRRGRYRRLNLLLSVLPFLFLTYSTFLTRSGVLADFSVHSFTDLGINQFLVAFMAVFFGGSLVLYVYKLKRIPKSKDDAPLFSRENLLFWGAAAFMVFGAIVCLGTSAPLISRLWGAPSSVEPEFYNRVVLPFGIVIALMLGVAPHLIWEHFRGADLVRSLRFSAIGSLVLIPVFVLLGVREWPFLILVITGVFAVLSNLHVVFRMRRDLRASGGALAHAGVGFMILGVLTSTAYDEKRVVELPQGETVEAMGYSFRYLGHRPVENGTKDAYDVAVNNGGSSFTVSPTMFYSDFNGSVMKKPAIHSRPTHDVYIAPGGYGSEGVMERAVRVLDLEKGNPQDLDGRTITFVGFQVPEKPADGDDGHGSHGGGMDFGANVQIQTAEGLQELSPVLKSTPQGLQSGPGQSVSGTGEVLRLMAMDATNGVVRLSLGPPPLVLGKHENGTVGGYELHVEGFEVDSGKNSASVFANVQLKVEDSTVALRPGFQDRRDMDREYMEAPIGNTGQNLVLFGVDSQTARAEFYVVPAPKETIWVEASIKPFIGWLWIGTGLVMLGLMMASLLRGKVAARAVVLVRPGSGGPAKSIGSRRQEASKHVATMAGGRS